MAVSTSANGGGCWWSRRGWSRPVDTLAHRVGVVACVVVGLIVLGALVGPDVRDTLALSASVVGLVWIIAQGLHTRRENLCVRCAEAMPSNPCAAVERGRVWLRLHHRLTDSPVVFVVYVGVQVLACLPTWLGWRGLDWLWFLPIAGLTRLWLHHAAVRPWCPYCREWDDGGDHEPSLTPDPAGTKPPGT